MQKVVSINLNGNAYHLEETGYDTLRAYLEDAATHLEDNPDRAEILADLEQAIAEKCAACLGPNKSVVSASEVNRIIQEMGPVRDPDAAETAGATAGERPRQESRASTHEAPKRLYQIREGAMLTGVCNGLAAYFNVDVTIVRIIFIALALLTKGGWVLVYVALSFFVPFANTAEERAAAHGVAFSAQGLVDRTRQQYRRQQREWARQWRRARRRGWSGWGPDLEQRASYAGQVWARAAAPVFGIAHAMLFVVLALAIASFVNDHSVFGWMVPESMPLWAGILILVVLFQIVAAPLHAARHAVRYGYYQPSGLQEVFGGLASFAATLFAFWLLYQYVPQVREFVHALPTIAHDIWHSLTQP